MAKAAKKEVSGNPFEAMEAEMNAKYGKGSVIGGRTLIQNDKVVSTGSIIFDMATYCGGLPVGKLVEMFGPESCGKSTFSLHIIAEYQKAFRAWANEPWLKGVTKKMMYMDFEHSFDRAYAESIGVDVDDLIISQPETMEDGYNILLSYIKSNLIGLAVIDSHTAMLPKEALEGDIGDKKMALQARINSGAIVQVKPLLDKFNCTVIGISQLRAPIGSMVPGDKPTGGNAWKFYADIRIKIYRTVDKEKELNKTFVEVIKNKCGKPFGKGEVPITWGVGIDKTQEVLELAVANKIVKQAGSWYSYEESKLGQGAESVKELLNDNPDLLQEIKEKLLKALDAEKDTPKENTVETDPDQAQTVTGFGSKAVGEKAA